MTTESRPNGPRKVLFAAAAVGVAAACLTTAPRPGGDAARAQEAAPAAAEGEGIAFLHALDNQPIEFTLRPEQEITAAVEEFHRTAENPYRDDPEAIAVGEELWNRWCQSCHLKDATGRIGPSLVDDEVRYPRAGTDRGMFEVIYAGGAGAMQAFGNRIDQDEILKLMAYVQSLRGE